MTTIEAVEGIDSTSYLMADQMAALQDPVELADEVRQQFFSYASGARKEFLVEFDPGLQDPEVAALLRTAHVLFRKQMAIEQVPLGPTWRHQKAVGNISLYGIATTLSNGRLHIATYRGRRWESGLPANLIQHTIHGYRPLNPIQ